MLKSERTTLRRKSHRGSHERAKINGILDAALHCHIGFVVDGQPYVIPTIHARAGDLIYLHGSPVSRMLDRLGASAPCCLTATIVDGLVIARSARQHSLNYRSAVVLGRASAVDDDEEKCRALQALVNHVAPGRSDEVRGPSAAELNGTSVLSMPISEGSAKRRTGPPIDKSGDRNHPVWAGEVPLFLSAATPIPVDALAAELPIPASLKSWMT